MVLEHIVFNNIFFQIDYILLKFYLKFLPFLPKVFISRLIYGRVTVYIAQITSFQLELLAAIFSLHAMAVQDQPTPPMIFYRF